MALYNPYGSPHLFLDPDGDLTLIIHGIPSTTIAAFNPTTAPLRDIFAKLPDLPAYETGGTSPALTPPNHPFLRLFVAGQGGFDADGKPIPPTEPLRILVSSKHLTTSSSYFASALKKPPEGPYAQHLEQVISSDGITLLYLLAILHCRTHLVPQSVPFRIIDEMAILVDYYGCYAAVKFVADSWIDAIRNVPIPENDEGVRLRWVFIAWVFRRNDIFASVTKELIIFARGRIGVGFCLPLSGFVTDALNHTRTKYLRTLTTSLIKSLPKLQKQGCRARKKRICKSKSNTELRKRLLTANHRNSENDLCIFNVVREYNTVLQSLNILPTKYLTPTPAIEGPDFLGLSIVGLLAEVKGLDVGEGPEYLKGERHAKCAFSYRMRRMLEKYKVPKGLDMEKEAVSGGLPVLKM
ncbi:uncharacterized protein BDV14DRAFT_64912 [Aspergillus stella-maris]|uniref:uncharacterized protein n=1 Tax=Aspergillus stella-maris TaxID=1810926 RepID=UPI003CCD3001